MWIVKQAKTKIIHTWLAVNYLRLVSVGPDEHIHVCGFKLRIKQY